MSLSAISIRNENELQKVMLRMKVFEKDIQETFVRSSGPGGQNVNKVATCVVLVHYPTGIQVKSQQERSQKMNRFRARCLLVARIDQLERMRRQQIIQAREKQRRQNRKRPKALKERILEKKKQQSQKKQTRQKVRLHAFDG